MGVGTGPAAASESRSAASSRTLKMPVTGVRRPAPCCAVRDSTAGNACCWPGRIRTGVPQLCRLVPSHSVTRPRRPRPDSNGRPAPSEGAALSICATRTCVPEPGADPGVPRRMTVYGPPSAPALTSGWGVLRESNPPCRDHNPAPSLDGKRHQCATEDSNLGPAACGAAALTTELIAHGTPGRT